MIFLSMKFAAVLAAVAIASVPFAATAQSPSSTAESTPAPASPASDAQVPPKSPKPAATPSTPLDRYQREVYSAIGKVWYKRTDAESAKFPTGPLHLTARFWVTPEGKITDIKLVSERGTPQAFRDVTAAALREASAPPIPHELVTTFLKRGMAAEVNFDLY